MLRKLTGTLTGLLILLTVSLSGIVAVTQVGYTAFENSTVHRVDPPGPIVRLVNHQNFLGTGFVFNSRNCVLTASHVVGFDNPWLVDDLGVLHKDYRTVHQDHDRDVAIMCPRGSTLNYPFKGRLTLADSTESGLEPLTFFSVTGFSWTHKTFMTHSLLFVGLEDVDLYPSTYKNALKFHAVGAELEPGYSGSPVVDPRDEGKVIGLMAYRFVHPQTKKNTWSAVNVSAIKEVLDYCAERCK